MKSGFSQVVPLGLAALMVAFAPGAQATVVKRVSFPALSPDGSRVAFSCQGDIWLMSTSGGTPTRLTVNPARDVQPRWTPDGKQIVFASERYGNSDVFIMNADGSNLRRLNYDSSAEQVTGVSADGKWVLGYTGQWGRGDCYKLSIDGGDLIRLTMHPLEIEFTPTMTADGKSIVYCSGGSGGTWRKAQYKGSNSPEIFIGDNSVPIQNIRKLTSNEDLDLFPMVSGNTIFFISNRSGWPNLWSMGLDGSRPAKLTNFSDGTMRWPSIAKNGEKIAFEWNSEIYIYDVAKKASKKLEVDIPDDLRTNPEVALNLTTGVSEYALSPDGKRIAFGLRGDLWLMPERGGTTRRIASAPAMDQGAIWLDDKSILFSSGRNGKRELFTTDTFGNVKPFFADAADCGGAKLSPDGKTLAFVRGSNELVTMPAAGGAAKVVVTGPFLEGIIGEPYFNFSPDSKWLVVNLLTDRGGTNVTLINLESGKQIVAMRAARDCSEPKFLPNGRGLYFTANEFENANLFVVDLVPDEVTYREDDLDKLDEPKKEEPKKGPVEVKIYEPGLELRVRQLTSGATSNPVASNDGKTIWANVEGQWTAIAADSGQATPVATVSGFVQAPSLDKSGNKLYFVSGGKLAAVPTNAPAPPAPISFSAQYVLNLREEERALFDEIWWAMDRGFYDKNMHGKDWGAIRKKFADVIPYAADRDDFYAIVGEMFEELNSSHQGATAPGQPTPGDVTGYFGVDWDWAKVANGQYVVANVQVTSPAFNPQSELKVGDQVIAVNGTTISQGQPLAKLLRNTSGKKTKVKIIRGGKELEIFIKPAPLASRSGLNYIEWVRTNRALVEKISNGQIAYHHYPSMDADSQANFLREIRSQTTGKKAIIIDARYNGGGFTAHQALGVLIKRPWLLRTRRDVQGRSVSENIYRGDSLELPSALMTNQYSFSNAEIFSEGFRRLKIGPVVGERTAGGVIGTGAYGLWDGGMIRMPAFGAYTVDNENLEGNGRRPDVTVLWDQNAYLQGHDVQLEAAVRELMKKIK